ncbi:tryptophan halogenase family protein [Microbulbifer pacificus]|uniref:Tryptophan halogenase family protein n=1 Tax=Microbulbifer pacificus TaxID=407164 RepID=A0AAU0N4B2_9GAMM|nr:tryptophan halogenase family protein [Microbulbifer pacificus]WOX06886.1 tryptophan halogenase family protein [Microbulbifer pacificus]
MNPAPFSILILGGGAAGWLTAAILAAEHGRASGGQCDIVVVESPGIPTVGVGEGTWPSMRETLRRIGLEEKQLFTDCEASFKQGSLFVGWRTPAEEDAYYHPFSLPHGYFEQDLAHHSADRSADRKYAYAVSPQPTICDANLAPKQLQTPEYAGVLNYGYHFDAVKFGVCLRDHCTSRLGVTYLPAEVTEVELACDGSIAALKTDAGERLAADLFIDCSGARGLLIDKYLKVPFIDQSSVLFNDRAMAVQIPYDSPDAPIASVTRSTARSHGWIWDIGLPTRRGMGYVYSSRFSDAETVRRNFDEFLRPYLSENQLADLQVRELEFFPGYRSEMWKSNCVAVGMSAGFIEPLEASALALIEHAAGIIRDLLPARVEHMAFSAKRYNRQMLRHWSDIIDFLKLHYVLSQRSDSEYWTEHRDAASIPESLQENLELWRHRSPAKQDFPLAQALFPAASYRYVLNGMGYGCDWARAPRKDRDDNRASVLQEEVKKQAEMYRRGLVGNRQLISQLIAGR